MKNVARICACIGLPVMLASTPVAAQLANVDFSPDITLHLAGVVTADENIARDNFSSIVLLPVGAIPANADVTVYHRLANGDSLLGFDITVELPGAVIARPADIVRFDGGAFSIEFDGTAEGIPAGVRIDALSAGVGGNLLMSFDTTVEVSGVTVSDEDIVEFDGMDFSLIFDGSAAGLESAVDLDAMHFATESGDFYLSFDTGGMVDGGVFSDEDLLRFAPGSGNWFMAYDGSQEHANWVAGDLDAAFVEFLVGFILKDGFEAF